MDINNLPNIDNYYSLENKKIDFSLLFFTFFIKKF